MTCPGPSADAVSGASPLVLVGSEAGWGMPMDSSQVWSRSASSTAATRTRTDRSASARGVPRPDFGRSWLAAVTRRPSPVPALRFGGPGCFGARGAEPPTRPALRPLALDADGSLRAFCSVVEPAFARDGCVFGPTFARDGSAFGRARPPFAALFAMLVAFAGVFCAGLTRLTLGARLVGASVAFRSVGVRVPELLRPDVDCGLAPDFRTRRADGVGAGSAFEVGARCAVERVRPLGSGVEAASGGGWGSAAALSLQPGHHRPPVELVPCRALEAEGPFQRRPIFPPARLGLAERTNAGGEARTRGSAERRWPTMDSGLPRLSL